MLDPCKHEELVGVVFEDALQANNNHLLFYITIGLMALFLVTVSVLAICYKVRSNRDRMITEQYALNDMNRIKSRYNAQEFQRSISATSADYYDTINEDDDQELRRRTELYNDTLA